MRRLILFLALAALAAVGVGLIVEPGGSLNFFADASPPFQQLRAALCLVMLLQLITQPPRGLVFRLSSGVLAAVVGGWAAYATLEGGLMPFDSATLLAAAGAVAVTALELDPYFWYSRHVGHPPLIDSQPLPNQPRVYFYDNMLARPQPKNSGPIGLPAH